MVTQCKCGYDLCGYHHFFSCNFHTHDTQSVLGPLVGSRVLAVVLLSFGDFAASMVVT